MPEILDCKEFVNADNIAAGLSPFNPERVALEAGRIMLSRIHDLLNERADFAFETTLSTRSYVSLIKEAKGKVMKCHYVIDGSCSITWTSSRCWSLNTMNLEKPYY